LESKVALMIGVLRAHLAGAVTIASSTKLVPHADTAIATADSVVDQLFALDSTRTPFTDAQLADIIVQRVCTKGAGR
jgi:hypothetical protein